MEEAIERLTAVTGASGAAVLQPVLDDSLIAQACVGQYKPAYALRLLHVRS